MAGAAFHHLPPRKRSDFTGEYSVERGRGKFALLQLRRDNFAKVFPEYMYVCVYVWRQPPGPGVLPWGTRGLAVGLCYGGERACHATAVQDEKVRKSAGYTFLKRGAGLEPRKSLAP